MGYGAMGAAGGLAGGAGMMYEGEKLGAFAVALSFLLLF